MTDADRRAILKEIERQRKAALANKEVARAALLRSGIYNQDGSLKAEYGGPKKRSAA